ncbi:MAG: hypothetical protein ABIN20_07480 [candidate division WOR-3 bacterium]
MNFLHIFIFIQTSLNFYYRTPLNSLYFLHRGFLDVSQGEGIIGENLNPASLHFGAKNELVIFGSNGFKTEIDFNIPIGIDSIGGTEIPKYEIPLKLTAEDKGGFDFLGAKTKVGLIDLGISYYNEEIYGANLDLNYLNNISLDLKIKDFLSKEDHPDIPKNVTIPVKIKLEGDGNLIFNGNGTLKSQLSPFNIGASIGFGIIGLGAGINIKRYSGKADLNYDIKGNFQSITLRIDSTFKDNLGRPWNVNISINGPFKDKIFNDKITGDFSGTQFGVVLGAKVQVPLITAGFSFNYNFPFTLSGGIQGLYSYIDGISKYLIDTNNITVDTINRTITGQVNIDSVEFFYNNLEHEILRKSLKFPGLLGLNAGANINLLIINLNLAGGIDLPQGRYAFGKAYFMVSSGFGAGFFHINYGSVFSWRYLKYEDFYLFTPPNVTFGLGSNLNLPFFSLYLGARTTPFLGVLSGIQKIGGQGKRFVNPLKTFAFNFGIKIKI